MKCVACDSIMTDFEATRKSKTTGQFLDLCEDCFKEVSDDIIDVEERADLKQLEHEIELGYEGD